MSQILPVRIAATCAQIAYDYKATDIRVLNITGLSAVADYFVIASGRSSRQLKAITLQIERMAKENGTSLLGVEGKTESTWILIDLGDVVVHLFDAATRSVYDLELLWGDAGWVEWQEQTALPFSAVPESPGFPAFSE